MLFNSIDFALFLPLVFALYWFVFNKNLKVQNGFLLVASYYFYGSWDPRFLLLIAFSSIVDYLVGNALGKEEVESKRKWLLTISIVVNLGFLAFFKYYNFFAENFAEAFTLLGRPMVAHRLDLILPVGISFYTFQTLSYSIDIYRRKLEPSKDFISFFAFVSFFPQLVAGPIERATNLLPQFYEKRKFDYTSSVEGMNLIMWGLFKKVVIADNCAVYANDFFMNSETYSGSTLLLGGIFFAFQIYGDFSGYSDIAIGTSRLFGVKLMRNFAFPYFSRDIAEFWRRWHISLSTWFRDYLYIPLGGSRGGLWMKVRNTFIIFVVSGFWHGANWTFVIWGFLNAMYFLPLLLLNRNRKNTDMVADGKLLPSIKEFFQMGITFFITVIAWIFFRAENLNQAKGILAKIFSKELFTLPEIRPSFLLALIGIFILAEWMQRDNYKIEIFGMRPNRFVRWCCYLVIAYMILFNHRFHEVSEFIYFQF